MRESDRQIENLDRYDGEAIYGLEWGDPVVDLPCVLKEWIGPRVSADTVAVEIGSGGGRWTRFFNQAKLLYSVDGTPKSEQLVRKAFAGNRENVRFIVSKDGRLPQIPDASVDYVFSYDTFVHFDRELFDSYLRETARILKLGGVLHLHYAQVLTENQSEDFKYREPKELFGTMLKIGFSGPIRRMFVWEGYGSVLAEAKLLNTK